MNAFEGDVAPGGWPRGNPNFAGRDRQRASPHVTQTDKWDGDAWRQQMEDAGLVRPAAADMLSRRKLLFGTAALATAALVDGKQLNPFAGFIAGKPLVDTEYHAKANEFKRILEQRYGIRLSMGPQQGQDRVLGDAMLLEKYRTVMEVLADELSKYPPEMLQKIGRTRIFEIRVIDNLYIKTPVATAQSGARAPKGGLAQASAADGAARISLKANEAEGQMRRNIHHELNHIFSFEWMGENEREKKWTQLNSKALRNPYAPIPPATTPDTPTNDRRFLNLYASSAAIEDQAVCAEWMMIPRLHMEFLVRWHAEQDPDVKNTLAAKYIETKNNYLNWSGGKMGEAFWQDIIARGVSNKRNTEKRG